MDKDEVELFNLQIALILCIYCVVVELLTGSSLVPVNFSTVWIAPYLKGIVSSIDAHFTESTNQ